MDQHLKYHNYLLDRTIFGSLYRQFFLYKIINYFCFGRVLDIGCGIGDFLKYRPNTIGVDINPYNVEYCVNIGLDARHAEPGVLPFEPTYFDTILLDNVLEHILVPIELCVEIKRVLKINGRLIIGIPGHMGYISDPDHCINYSKEELLKLFSIYGFIFKKQFSTPSIVASNYLSKNTKSYCVYYLFDRVF
jgi:SAM-dependent methyltransferase